MADLAAPRLTGTRNSNVMSTGIAAGVIGYRGGMAMPNSSGYHDPANAVKVAGVILEPDATSDYDNSAGLAGAKSIKYETNKIFTFDADAGNAPGIDDIGEPGYASDDNHISTNSADGPYAGIIRGVTGTDIDIEITADVGSAKLRAYQGIAATQTIGLGDAIALTGDKIFYPIVSDGGAVTMNQNLPAGILKETGRVIHILGQSDVNVLTIPDGMNCHLRGGISIDLKDGDGICLMQRSNLSWWEAYRYLG